MPPPFGPHLKRVPCPKGSCQTKCCVTSMTWPFMTPFISLSSSLFLFLPNHAQEENENESVFGWKANSVCGRRVGGGGCSEMARACEQMRNVHLCVTVICVFWMFGIVIWTRDRGRLKISLLSLSHRDAINPNKRGKICIHSVFFPRRSVRSCVHVFFWCPLRTSFRVSPVDSFFLNILKTMRIY